jgi:hypothetical protein
VILSDGLTAPELYSERALLVFEQSQRSLILLIGQHATQGFLGINGQLNLGQLYQRREVGRHLRSLFRQHIPDNGRYSAR